MKISNRLTRFPRLLTIALWACAGGILPAAEPEAVAQKPVPAPRSFASPEAAIKALQTATEAKDKSALSDIFGPEFKELLTGDEVQDANNARQFAAAVAQGCAPVKEGEDKITLEI